MGWQLSSIDYDDSFPHPIYALWSEGRHLLDGKDGWEQSGNNYFRSAKNNLPECFVTIGRAETSALYAAAGSNLFVLYQGMARKMLANPLKF